MKLAFLAAQFPSLTTTFLFREWVQLNKDPEIDVHVFSIRRPPENWKREVAPEEGLVVDYLRPDHLSGILVTAIVFPLMHPVIACRILKAFVKELFSIPPRQHMKLFFQMLAGIYLGRYLKKKEFTAIHGHFSSASHVGLFAHYASGISFTFTLYASDDLFIHPKPFFDAKIAACRLVTTDTEYNKRLIRLLCKNRIKEKLHVVYSGVDINEFHAVTNLREKGAPIKLLSVGSMVGVKGYVAVVEALSILKTRNVDFEYHIVGGGQAWEKEWITDLIEEFDLGDHVKLLGPQQFEFVRKEMDWCDVFVMASEIQEGGRRDGLPTVIIEAMLLKRLVLSTYISDIPNNVVNHKTGLIVPEKSPALLANALIYAYEHPEECLEMVENAYQMAVNKFDAEKNYTHLAALLKG